MGNQSTKDYRFPEKHKWRQWSWRQIKKRLWERGIRTKDAKGLYLAAESDKDRDVACRKNGFRPENLIAVEKDPATVKKLRAKKVVVIEGDIWDSIDILGSEMDFLHLDFCNGFSQKTQDRLYQSLHCTTGLLKTCHPICINLLRGRDASPILDYVKNMLGEAPHRGVLFLIGLLSLIRQQTIEWGVLPEEENYFRDVVAAKHMAPDFMSYKSGNVMMDSVVFNMPLTVGHIFKEDPDAIPSKSISTEGPIKTHYDKLKPRHRAAKAIRTQRVNGTKAPSPVK